MLPTLLLGLALVPGQPPTQPALPSLSPPTAQVVPPPFPPVAVPVAGPALPVGRDEPATAAPGNSQDCPPGCNGANGGDKKENPNEDLPCLKPRSDEGGCFYHRLYRAYYKQCFPDPNGNGTPSEEPPPPRRALPAPFGSPFPSREWQGFPLIGVPPSTNVYPLM